MNENSPRQQIANGSMIIQVNHTTNTNEFNQFKSNLDNMLFNKNNNTTQQDTNKIEEIPAKEPDLSKKPKKSALKKETKTVNNFRNQRPRFQTKLDESAEDSSSCSSGVGESSDSDCDSDIESKNRNDHNLLTRVHRNDSLARFLKERPQLHELVEKNIIRPPEQRKIEREEIEIKLDRKLSLRPTPRELEQRNILHTKTQEEIKKEIEETKKMLVRKLSYRPTIQELRDKRIIRFHDYIEVTEVEDYDRRADKPWTRLTPKDKAAIRNELNLYKSTEMEVHEESRHLIRFHKP